MYVEVVVMADFVEMTISSGFLDYGINICFDCKRACGGCSWSAIDDRTGEVQFKPVPGWQTKKRSRKNGRKWEIVEQIIWCPLFVSDRRVNRKCQNTSYL